MPFLVFRVTLVHGNLCFHTFTHMTVTLRGAGSRGLFKTINIVESGKLIERLENKYWSLKMYVCLEYQSILHDKINNACLKKSTIPLMFQALK